MSRRVEHQMLVANAGSGKTFSLTTRVVKLLALGVEPKRIAALTFTKKAAGEFLDAVFERIAEAVLDPEKLAKLREATGVADLDAAACRAMLRRMVRQLGGLCMGTIDSLFARIARAFPAESGLTGDFSILGDSDVAAAREDALATLFRERTGEGFEQFLTLVRLQSRKGSERDVFGTLLKAVAELQDRFLETPPDVTWGAASAIWPRGNVILDAVDPREAAEALREAITTTHPELHEVAATWWDSALDAAAAVTPGMAWPKLVDDLLKKLGDPKVKDGEEFPYFSTTNRKAARVSLYPDVESAAESLQRALLRLELMTLLRRSRALHEFMAAFEVIYDRQTRGLGRLTFTDITDVLARRVEDLDWLSSAGYRLDSRYDHWLLDEFQDTSRPQWAVLSTFVDEVVQDPGGERSFFYVGDTKQALYLWRGGDPRLFFEIRDKYNQAGDPVIIEEALSASHRSAVEVIDFVNLMFSNVESVKEPLGVPAQTVQDWNRAWREHTVAERDVPRQGYVRWSTVEGKRRAPEEGTDDEDSEDGLEASPQDREVLRILNEVEPWTRGLSCAALKRDNRSVVALASLLQAEGIPVSVEGKSNPCVDNPLGSAVVAAFRWLASPGDELAGVMLAGSVLGQTLLEEGRQAFRERSMREIAAAGFADTIRGWLGRIDLIDEPFLASRAVDLLEAAAEFDADRGSADGIHAFLDFLDGWRVQEAESSNVVRVMTVHQAKGLTFDMTVVSGLDALSRDRLSGTLALGGDDPKTWGLLMPKREIAEADEVLREAREAATAEAFYGSLCTLYVAITRPSYGLYVVTDWLKEDSKAKTLGRWLGMCVDADYEAGLADWFERVENPPAPIVEVDVAAGRGGLVVPVSGTPRPVSPSRLTSVGRGEPRGGGLGSDALEFGNAVHAALANLEWLEAGEVPNFEGCESEVRDVLAGFFVSDEARVFQRPEGLAILWKERSFDVVVDGVWVAGIFDRVHVWNDSNDQPVRAAIYDFKTDSGGKQVGERYAGQLEAYRRAGAQLLGLELEKVSAEVVVIERKRIS